MAGPVGRMLRRAAYARFGTALLYEVTRDRMARRGREETIVVFQMGKVGSSTVVSSLKALEPGYEVLRAHALTRAEMRRVTGRYRETFRNKRMVPPHLVDARRIRRRMRREGAIRRVVTLVRDPVARNLSSFFQVFDRWFPDVDREAALREKGREEAARELTDRFLEVTEHEGPLTWFDREMEPVFGLDVYASPFPHERGFTILRAGDREVLVVRLEDLDTCAEEAFGEFLGRDDFRVVRTNVGEKKQYRETYRAFQDGVILPPDYLERMYASKLARHFYTDDERSTLRDRWARGARSPGT